MRIITGIQFMSGSNEERLPDFSADFPCITTCAVLDQRTRPAVPWHWHKALELVFIQSGSLIYETPGGRIRLDAGCGALVNSNMLHATSLPEGVSSCTQLLHLFDPVFLAGTPGSQIDLKYICPITTSPSTALIPLFPDQDAHAAILPALRESFALQPDEPGYEILLREKLSSIWLHLYALVKDTLRSGSTDMFCTRAKRMMSYIHEHYDQPISAKALAQAAICSERECYRTFHACLHMTPNAYLQSYRLQMACRMLAENRESLTSIAHSCGFGSSSYLGKIFRAEYGMTPIQYRKSRQNP